MNKYNYRQFIDKVLKILLFLFFIMLLSGCGSSKTTVINYSNYLTTLHQMGIDKYIGIQPTTETTDGNWDVYYYDPSSPARCFNGNQYIVSLHRGDPKKVILYLEGGGACWSYDTCYKTPMAKSSANPPEIGGFLDTSNPKNPFKDYSIVYASYCDGSVWSGDNDISYNGVMTYFHGFANLSAAVTLMKENFINPDKILISGSSAGGYGTFMGYLVTRTQYPFTTLDVINDSGPGLSNPNSSMLETTTTAWNLNKIMPADCPKCKEQMTYLIDWTLDRDQKVYFGLFSYYNDVIIGTVFLNLSGPDYKKLLLSVTDEIHNNHPEHFKRFFVNGSMHTILELSSYYTGKANGTYFSQWTADMMTDTSAWHDILQK